MPVDRFPRASSAPKRSLLSQSCDGIPHHGERATNGQPRRPKTTPKPRVRRLLLGPGQAHSSEISGRDDVSLETESFMTQLPPSPPRMKASIVFAAQDDTDIDAVAITEEKQELTISSRVLAHDEQVAVNESASSSAAFESISLADGDDEKGSSFSQTEEAEGSASEETVSNPDRSDLFFQSDHHDEGNDTRTDANGNEDSEKVNDLSDERSGPQAVDVDVCTDSSSDQNSYQPEDDLDNEDPAADTEKLSLDEEWLRCELESRSGKHAQDMDNDKDDEEYRRSLASRQQFQDEDVRRQVVRVELQSYVASLTTRKDESGDAFVTFPKNYDQVVSLMTEQDMRDEDSDPGAGASTSHNNWSRVLIQNALLKQNAYAYAVSSNNQGVLDGGDEDSTGDGLTAKIALKMARIRQLDAVLEEKLGKNLYAGATAANKRANNPTENEITSRLKTFVTQPQSVAKSIQQEPSVSRSGRRTGKNSVPSVAQIATLKGKLNFVERNKQVVENGMRANLTKDEEARLGELLGGAAQDANETMGNAEPSSSSGTLDINVFAMDADEKQAIEQLLSVKREDDLSFLLAPLAETNARELSEGLARKETGNVIQANRVDRLQRQRLERIDQELRLLQETQAIEIQADEQEDDEDNESVMDDCQSEMSYKTSVSMSSTCSTRSGVISRREFSRFVAAEVARSHNEERGVKASSGAIQGLLSSFTHLFARPEAAMAT